MNYLITWKLTMQNSLIKPTFSIIIPTYNHGHLIKKCIDSLIAQTYSNWEAIIVNNFSSDNTIEVIDSYKEPRIKLINYANNGIIAASRNIGISNSYADWICFLDSDDWWYFNKLETVNNYIADHAEIDFVCHDIIINNKLTGKRKLLCSGPVVDNLYSDLLKHGNRFPNSATTIRKSIMEKSDIKINESARLMSVEDYDLNLQLAANNAKFACINVPLSEYLIESNNVSGSKIHLENLEFLLRMHVFTIQTFEQNKAKLWREVCSRLNIIKGTTCFNQGKYYSSMRWFLISFWLSKNNFIKYLTSRFILAYKRIGNL